MEIHGIQKMTLLDYPEKVACTIFTARCNFRCPFCHNASLVTHVDAAAAISEEEVFSFLAKRQGILDGVCITGGEPLLQPDIEEFIRKVKELGYQVKLDTNGSNVLRLRRLVEQGLVDYVAMDIKNAPDKYGMTIGIEEYDMSNIFQSVDFLMSGDVPFYGTAAQPWCEIHREHPRIGDQCEQDGREVFSGFSGSLCSGHFNQFQFDWIHVLHFWMIHPFVHVKYLL